MILTDFCGEMTSLLGLGAMRLPKLENGEIDKLDSWAEICRQRNEAAKRIENGE